MSDRLLLDFDGIRARGIRFSRQWINILVRRGEFPKPIKIGRVTNAWPAAEIDAYIESRIADRDEQRTA